jgi:predicted nuclease of predicted toxin-antitoxin system
VSLLLDQNLSWRLTTRVAAEFPGCQQVTAAGLSRANDRAIWAYAVSAGLANVSKDKDFVELANTLGPPRR